MSISVNNAALREVPQTEQPEQVEAKNISYKANPNNTLERTPDGDYYDNQRKKKTIGIVAGLILTTAAVVGGICWHKGKSANGEEKKFFDRLKDGWKELTGKGKKAAEDGAGKAEEAASGAKSEAESAANGTKTESENAAREATETVAKETENAAGNATETVVRAVNKVEVTEETMKEYLAKIPETDREAIVDIIDSIIESGGKVHFAKNEKGANILVFNPAKRNLQLETMILKNDKELINSKEIELSSEILDELNSKTLKELNTTKQNVFTGEKILSLNSLEESYADNSRLVDEFSSIDEKIKKCLSEDKEFSKKLLENFIGKEELEKLSDDEVLNAVDSMFKYLSLC